MAVLTFVLCLLSLVMFMNNVAGQAIDETHIDYHNPLLNGATCDSNTLQAAITAIGNNQKTLYLTATNRQKVACVWNITTSVTIPDNITLRVPFGITANIASGVVITANRCIRADDPGWHTGSGTVVQTATNCGDPNALFGGATQASFVQHECYHSTAGSNAATIPSCTAFIGVGTGATRITQRIQHTAPQIITYTGGNGTYYVIARADNTVTPSGWTCTANTPYCWILAASKPSLPSDTTWLLRVTVTDNVITASHDISYRRFAQYTSLTTSMTIGREGVWEFPPHTGLSLPLGVTITNEGCIKALPQSLFTGQGLVVFTQGATCPTLYAEWFGAVGDGLTPGQEVFFTKASEALPQGGVILGAGATAHYLFNDQWNIKASDITFDGQNCLFSSTATTGQPRIRAWDGGTRASAGETAQFLHNVHLRNYRVGVDPLTNTMRGGALFGCVNCSIENVIVNSGEGTSFTLFRAQSSLMRNVHIVHGGGGDSEFCTILIHSNNTLVDNWSCRGATDGTGPCCNALQVKGGIGNTIANTLVENLKNPEELKRAYWSRGDAPWSDSQTNPDTHPYPFSTNGALNCKVDNCYSQLDARRATQHTQWINNKVKNVYPGHCWAGQEGYGDSIVNFYGEDCRAGIVYNQTAVAGSGERDLTISNFHLKNIGLDATTGDGLYAISILGAGSASADGQAVAATNFQNIAMSSGIIDGSAGPGVGIRNASNVTVHNVTIKNASQKAVSEPFGVYVAGMNRDNKFIGNRIIDDMNPPKLTGGLRIAENVIAPTAIGNSILCTNCVFGTFNAIRALPVGRYAQNTPAFCTALTTDATPDHQRCVLLTKSGDRFKILSSCVARQGATNRAYYERTAIVEDNGGVLTIYPNISTGDITFESDGAWDVTYAAVLEELRIRPQGGVGQNVEWYCDVETISLIP